MNTMPAAAGAPVDGVHMSLFDVEDVEQMPKVRDMVVGPVTPDDVQQFARRYHYTGTGGNMVWRWGLWNIARKTSTLQYRRCIDCHSCGATINIEDGD